MRGSSELTMIGAVSTARVVRADDPTAPAVRSERFGTIAARVAVLGGYSPSVGDSVLVAHDDHGNRYVVGVLRAERAVMRVSGDLAIEAGGKVEIRAAHGVEIASGGDVAVRGREVDLAACSGGDVQSGVHLDHHVAVHGKGRVDVVSCASDGSVRSGLSLDGDAARLSAGVLSAKAAHLHAIAERVTVAARDADVVLDRLRQRAGAIESEVGTIVERAKRSYRTVEELAQIQAGRLKLVADDTLHTLAARVKMRAKRAFAIDGERIYLG